MAKSGMGTWVKNFGKAVSYASVNVVTGLAPNTADIIRSSRDTIMETRRSIVENKGVMNTLNKQIQRSTIGKESKKAFEMALKDIKSGTFGMERVQKDMTDLDWDLPEIDPELEASGSFDLEIADFNKDVTITSTMALLESQKQSTAIIGNTTINSMKGLSQSINNTMITAMNRINQNQMQANNYLANIDANIANLITFQNESTSVVNQATLNFMEETKESFEEMFSLIKEMKNNEPKKTKRISSGDYLFRGSMDIRGYKDYLKENIDSIFPFFTLAKDFAPMAGETIMGSGTPLSMKMLQFAMKQFIPKGLRKGIEKVDSNLPKYTRHLLMKMGNWENDPNSGFLKMVIGSIFGIKSPEIKSLKLGNYKKGATTFDGTTKRSIEEVIPDLLSKSNMYLAKLAGEKAPEKEYYNYDKGEFISESKLKSKYTEDVRDTALKGMSASVTSINDAIKKMDFENMTDREIQSLVSEMQLGISKIFTNNMTNRSKVGLKNSAQIQNLLQGAIQNKSIEYINKLFSEMDIDKIVGIEDEIFDTKVSVKDFMDSITDGMGENAVYRNIFNRDKKKSKRMTKDAINGTNFFNDLDILREREEQNLNDRDRRLRDANDRINDRRDRIRDRMDRRGTDNFNDRIESLFDRLDQTLFRFADGQISGSDILNGARRSRDNVVNRVRTRHTRRRRNQGQENTNTHGGMLRPGDNIDSYERNLFTTTQSLANSLSTPMDTRDSIILDDDANGNTQAMADIYERTADVVQEASEKQTKSFGGLVYGLYSTYLKPSFDMVFGKDGLIGKYILNDRTKEMAIKIKKFLFGEKNPDNNNAYENGILSGVANKFMDAADYIKYAFTGKGYTNREGKSYADTDNSVLGFLGNGLEKFSDLFMQFVYGDDYHNNENYKKSPFAKIENWWNTKRGRNKEESEDEKLKTKESKDSLDKKENTAKYNTYQIPYQKFNPKELKMTTNDLLGIPNEPQIRTNNRNARGQLLLGYDNDEEPAPKKQQLSTYIDTTEKADAIIIEGAYNAKSEIENIGHTLSEATVGEDAKEPEKFKKSFLQKFKAGLPKVLLGGVLGAATIGLSGGSLGLLGSLFLPSGILGGAIVGSGVALLSQSEKFQKFMFGDKDENGERKGGLINKKLQESFKKSLPIMAGGAVLGVLKNAVGFGGGPIGMMASTLLPGGIIGGALLGMGASLITRNATFQKIVFGEKDEDGKRQGGALSKAMNKGSAIIQKSFNFITGGIKGAAIGGLTAGVVSKMGILGAALTPFGPVGGALVGAGIGIASQTERFKKLLFGEKDEETGKRKGGLITKAANMINIHLIEPAQVWAKDMMVETAATIRENITKPIKAIFRPIGNTMQEVKQSIEDSVHKAFESIANGVTNIFEKTLAPIGNFFVKWILSPIGKTAGFMLKSSVKTTAGMIGAPLKLAANIMNFKRTKNNLKTKWAERNGSGITEVFAKGLDIINLANPFADMRTEEEKAEDQMVEDERQKVRNEKKLLKLRQQYQRQDKYAERTLSEKEFLKRRKAFLRMGIKEEDLQSQQDLNNFIYRNNLKSTTEEDVLKASNETTEYQDTVKTKINDIAENLRKIVKGETKGAEIINDTINTDDLLRKLYGDNDISRFKNDEVIDVDYEVDSSYEKYFKGRNDLKPKEIEMISNTAEAVEAGMTQATINNEKRSLKDKFKEKIQGLSFLSKKDKEPEGDAQVLQLEGEKEETKTGGILSKIFGTIGSALGNIGTFIVKHPAISAGIGAALGTVLYDSLKSSGMWDKLVVPVMDKLKDTVAQGIEAGWKLIKQGGANTVQGIEETLGGFWLFDDGTLESKKKLIERVGSDYIMNWNSSESKANAKLNSIKKKMEAAGYTNDQIDSYIEKLDQTRNTIIQRGKFLPNEINYSAYELSIDPENGGDTSIGNGKKSIGRGKNKASAIIPHMSQNDTRWSNQVIGNRDDGSVSTISNGGCGMTSLAMIANSLGRKTNPSEVAALATGYGYTADGGSTEDLFTKGSAQLGLSSHKINKGNLVNALASGKPVIIAGKSNDGVFSKEGHIIAASGLDKNGNAWVDDPENNGKTKVSVNRLLSGMTHAWDFTKGPKRASIGTALKNIGRANIKLINGDYIKEGVINGSSATQPEYVSEDIINNLKAKGIDTSLIEKNNAQLKANQSTSKTNTQKTGLSWNLFNFNKKNKNNTATSTTTNKSIGITGSPDGKYVLSDGSTVEIKNGAVYYNQGDDRWANVSMGGGTIKSIGCVLSSFAMGLASLLNKDYNPAVTYNTFKSAFTGGGAIKWDDFASQVESRLGVSIKSETADSAVSQLKKNIPVVLFGNRVSGGLYGPPDSNTHCVLGISSDGDGVVINDPGFRSNSENKHSVSQLKTGFLKAYSMSLGGNGISGINSDMFSSMTYGTGDTPGGGTTSGGAGGFLSGIASWLSPLFKPLQQLGAVMMNKMYSLISGEDYQSVFDGSGNYIGSLFGDIMTGMVSGNSSSSYQPGNFSDAANAYVDGKWDTEKLKDQDLKLYGPDTTTAEDLNGWVQAKSPNSFWRDKGSVIMEASRRTGLDPRYILAHAVHETGWTVSKIAQDKNNFFGIGAFTASPYASAYNWSGTEAGIIGGAEWINEHYYESKYHQNTIRKMRWNNGVHQYADDELWDQKIANIWSGAPGVRTKQTNVSSNNVFNQNKVANELANNGLTNNWVKQSLQNSYPNIYGNTQLNNGVNLNANTSSKAVSNPSNSARMKLYNTALNKNNLGYGKKGTGNMVGYKKSQTSKPQSESQSMDKSYKELNNIFAKTSKVIGLGKKLGCGLSQKVVSKNTDDMMKTVKDNASGTVKKFNLNGIGQGKFQEKRKLQEVDRKLQVSLNSKDINTKLDTLIQVERDLAKAILNKGSESVTNVTNNYTNIGNGKTVEKTVVKKSNPKPQSNNSSLRRQHDLITRGVR